ncbi:MAG: enoyl-CoA hydratase/isomerase family protein [Planctomycetota bacterium]
MIEREVDGAVVVMKAREGNLLNIDFLEAIDRELAELEHSKARSIVITGATNVFSAGVDLLELTQGGAPYVRRFLPLLSTVFQRLLTYPKPVIAAVNGHAIAGGCILCLECDYRIMAYGPGKIGLTELPVGVPFPPLVLEIVRLLAPSRFNRVVNLGLLFPAEEGLELGLVDEVVDPSILRERSMEIAHRLAEIPPGSFRLTKLAYRQRALDAAERANALFLDGCVDAWCSDEVQKAIQAFIARNIKRA